MNLSVHLPLLYKIVVVHGQSKGISIKISNNESSSRHQGPLRRCVMCALKAYKKQTWKTQRI